MSLRRILSLAVQQDRLCSNASLTRWWKPIPLMRPSQRLLHIDSTARSKFKLSLENPCAQVINQVIPAHDLESSKMVTLDDWRSNRESFKDAKMFRSILIELGRRRLYDAGKSYIEMVKKYEPQMLSPFNEIYVLRFLIHCSPEFGHFSDDEDIEYVKKTYSKLKKAFPVLDYFSSETLILAMQKTPDWKVSLELLDDLSLLQKPRGIVYSTIIINALRNNDAGLAWSLIDKMKDMYLSPHEMCWVEWLQLCRKSRLSDWKDGIGRMLEYCHKYHIQMSCTVADEVAKFIGDFCPAYSVQKSFLENTLCSECSTKLSTEFNKSDHADLKEMVEKMLHHDSIYASTTPAELEKFKAFIENCKPYDIVIDGLNAIYNRRSISLSEISSLKTRFKCNLLFLGRAHLAKRKDFRDIANLCQVFLCENLTRDDVYMLYAAVYRRPDVRFLSDDKMRSQVYYLNEDSRRNLFLRWQFLNQAVLSRYVKFNSYLPEIHKSEDEIYHIPCIDETSMDLTWTPVKPKYWLCIHPGPLNSPEKGPKLPLFEKDKVQKNTETTSNVLNADGSTIIDDLLERIHQSKTPNSNEERQDIFQSKLPKTDEVQTLIRGFQNKYRSRERYRQDKSSSSGLTDSLSQREVNEKEVMLKLKERFQQMHVSKENKRGKGNQTVLSTDSTSGRDED